MTQSETHDPLPPHIVEVIHKVAHQHLSFPSELSHIGPLARLGQQVVLGQEVDEVLDHELYSDIADFMEKHRIYPSNVPEFTSASRLCAVRKFAAALPGELKNALPGDSQDVIPQGADRHFDLANKADQPLSA